MAKCPAIVCTFSVRFLTRMLNIAYNQTSATWGCPGGDSEAGHDAASKSRRPSTWCRDPTPWTRDDVSLNKAYLRMAMTYVELLLPEWAGLASLVGGGDIGNNTSLGRDINTEWLRGTANTGVIVKSGKVGLDVGGLDSQSNVPSLACMKLAVFKFARVCTTENLLRTDASSLMFGLA